MSSFEINLLPRKQNKVADTLLHFILYYFRYIIVITQIVVIGVFFYRFSADQNVIDLKESFKQKQQILAVTIPIVEEAKILESKTSVVRSVIDEQELFLARLNFLVRSIPQDITLMRLEILDNEASVHGIAVQALSVRALHRKIQLTEGFEAAEITSLERQINGKFDFVIRIPLTKNEKS